MEDFKGSYQAINYIYSSLQDDKADADTAAIIQKLNAIVADAIQITPDAEGDRVFDISKVNFDILRREFAKSDKKATDTQDLREVIQSRLAKMLGANPTLANFEDRFDKIIKDYNKEKDKNTIEATFEALMRLAAEMEAETLAHVALGLSAEQKPIFDLLFREDLSKEEIRQIKSTSLALLTALEKRMEQVHDIFGKQSTRAALRQDIYDLLYDEKTGLPASKYDEDELDTRTDGIFSFFEKRYHQGISYSRWA